MSNSQRKRDKKRKKELAKKRRDSRLSTSLAYSGMKYKTDRLVPIWLETEIGIYETYVMTDRKLLDRAVVTALEKLIQQMRAGTLTPIADVATIDYDIGHEEDFIIDFIRCRWARHFETRKKPAKNELVGVLRSILGSIERMRAPGSGSQSYLRHIASFLTKKLGVSIRKVTADMNTLPDPDEDDLVRVGRQWTVDENQDAKADFYELANDLLRNGHADRVLEACDQLLREESVPSSRVGAELIELSHQARRSLITAIG